MTENDYKAAQAEFERIIFTHPDYAGKTIHANHPVAVIGRAIRIADKLMQEPSITMTNKVVSSTLLQSRELAKNNFKAMRDQMLKEVE